MKLQINSTSSSYTEKIGNQIGQCLRGGEVILLVSDLGGGKTTLTRGIVRGTGSADLVTSPTFTISNIYDASQFKVRHFDFYRLNEPGIMADELKEQIADSTEVIIIEWGQIIKNVLPDDKITITIDYKSEASRLITIQASRKFKYLFDYLA